MHSERLFRAELPLAAVRAILDRAGVVSTLSMNEARSAILSIRNHGHNPAAMVASLSEIIGSVEAHGDRALSAPEIIDELLTVAQARVECALIQRIGALVIEPPPHPSPHRTGSNQGSSR